MITRFAPSPTGLLHLGHARSALTGWRAAHAAGGTFLLRLEDIDPGRCRREFASAIEQDLAWLGLNWNGPVRAQSAHMADYRRTLDRLADRGLLFPCFCTRADILAATDAPHRAPDGAARYPGTCRTLAETERADRIAAGTPYALRLDMARACRIAGPLDRHEHGAGLVACRPHLFGDVVLARKEVPASYHLCVTHDDAAQGVTLVTRGIDLMPSTDLHRLLQALLGWPAPDYAHHALLHDDHGRRLSKRDGAPSLRAMREAGLSPQAVRAMAGVD